MTLFVCPQTLLAYCAHGDHEANKERLIREIMNVDNIDWDRANVSSGSLSSFCLLLPHAKFPNGIKRDFMGISAAAQITQEVASMHPFQVGTDNFCH
jgi:hypothetical protein